MVAANTAEMRLGPVSSEHAANVLMGLAAHALLAAWRPLLADEVIQLGGHWSGQLLLQEAYNDLDGLLRLLL
jgi:hypothetical protein